MAYGFPNQRPRVESNRRTSAPPASPQVSFFEQTTSEKNGLMVTSLLFRFSFALDHSSDIQVALIESLDAAEVFQGLKQQFPSTYEKISINAIVESRQSDDTTAALLPKRTDRPSTP